MKTKSVYYYEVSVAKEKQSSTATDRNGRQINLNPFQRGSKVHWIRKGTPRDTFAECQADAIANGERPYRIKSENANVPEMAS